MSRSAPNILQLARALADHDVRYVLIGGFAMVLHGSNQVTEDCDLAVAPDPANLDRLVEALRPLHPKLLRGQSTQWTRDAIAGSFTRLDSDAGTIDIMPRVLGVESFAKLYERAVRFDLEGTTVPVASVDDLIAMKSLSRRERDAVHLKELQAIRRMGDAVE
ncbi:MAG TPA: nucleotidyl transferase AbiEii/AbiGii toxin family protein [Fimbriimonadaceae bacterium]|nr:nucleotidyl transferase AbiEii/AbiGii toxin family protein [Fimbriimonadaceae bacterium]